MSKQVAIDDIDSLTMTIADKAIDAACISSCDDELDVDGIDAMEVAADEAAQAFGLDADEVVAAMKYHLRQRAK
jgi:hypothetical protein